MTAVDVRPQHAPVTDPLAPVRAALLARARRDAQRLLTAAVEDAAAVLDAAGDEVLRIRDQAHAEATEYVASVLASQRARARREARTIVLRAQRAAYDQLLRRAREAVRQLRDDPGYPALLDRLAAMARAELGPDATVREHAHGGVVAEAGGRRISFTLPALADRALAELLASREGS